MSETYLGESRSHVALPQARRGREYLAESELAKDYA